MPKPKFYSSNITGKIVSWISNYSVFLGENDDLADIAMDIASIRFDGSVRRTYLSDNPEEEKEPIISNPRNVAKITRVLSSLLEKTQKALGKTKKESDPYTHAMLSIFHSELYLP